MKIAIIRGLILGGSFGIFASLFNITSSILGSAIVGSIAGALAGYTAKKLELKKKSQ